MPKTGLESVRRYYDSKLKRYGPTARGVDWNSAAGQKRRFELLLKEVGPIDKVNDLGCGWGAMLDHLGPENDYVGYDISRNMIRTARKLYPDEKFVVGDAIDMEFANWTIASGIFNVMLPEKGKNPYTRWLNYVDETLEIMRHRSNKGFAFNCLCAWAKSQRKNLFYMWPLEQVNKLAALNYLVTLHFDGLHEFTLIARKQC